MIMNVALKFRIDYDNIITMLLVEHFLQRSEHKLSIIHVFMGSEMHVPKVRQKLYDRVDLIGECYMLSRFKIIKYE